MGETILKRYRVVGELGQGGMGVVYKCLDEVGGIDVALKALPPELSHNSVEMEQVRENFRLVERLHHPNIAAVKTLERDDDTGDYYLILECIEGMDLWQWLRQKGGRATGEDTVAILRHVSQALDYAHGQNVIHRDIKPANVMVCADGWIKVLDFGLAAQIQTSLSRVSEANYGTSGTAPYMAPEQWRGQYQDAATDQYALAVVAYELLAGRLPFESQDAVVLREAVLREEPLRVEGLGKRAWAALQRGLAKKREERYGSCAGFVEALAGGTNSKAREEAAGPRQRIRTPLAVAVGAVALVLGGFLLVMFEHGRGLEPAAAKGALSPVLPAVVINGVSVDAPTLQYALAAAKPEVQANLPRISFGMRYGDYASALAAVEKIASDPSLTDEQKKLANQVLEQIKQVIARMPPPAEEPQARQARGAGDVNGGGLAQTRALAEKGDAAAQAYLGMCYATGFGVARDLNEAARWYRKAAEQGSAAAQAWLGLWLSNGQGTPPDFGEAVKWLRKGAEQGNAAAQTTLASCYANGQGVARDLKEAAKWYRKAAEQGNADGEANLGACYYNGAGVARDRSEAVRWYLKAAEQGYSAAQNNVGMCYATGDGVAKDFREAVKWFRRAGELGLAPAQNNLGLCYERGEGAVRSMDEAKHWYRRAAEQGDESARKNLARLGEQ